MIDIYQFVNYNANTSVDHFLNKKCDVKVFCFDLEDGIENKISSQVNAAIKSIHRKYLLQILTATKAAMIKAGIRINTSAVEEQLLDIELLSGIKKIHSIFLPKTETEKQINILLEELDRENISYKELIPIIETKKGMDNVSRIVNASSIKIKKIAFGHCDYNLSIGAFPFYHQNSSEYWKWIQKIIHAIANKNITLVNSPFLELENDNAFKDMLSNLNFISARRFGQITLTYRQSQLCEEFDTSKKHFDYKKNHRFHFNISIEHCKNLIETYENGNEGKAFTITDNPGRLISPHEYLAAKEMLTKIGLPDLNFVFVGGCFPVQHNITVEDTFHQRLKRKIESLSEVNFNIHLIRYERFSTCLSKIQTQCEKNKVDFLVFHIRPEPYLRLVKFYYKYLNTSRKVRGSLNIPILKIVNPEKYDVFDLTRSSVAYKPSESKIYKQLINFNYILGIAIGNKTYALRKYLELVNEIIIYCDKKNISLIVLGPPLRTNTKVEIQLSKGLHHFFKTKFLNTKVKYVNGNQTAISNEDAMFHANGIHATEKYHEWIARIIAKEILSKQKVQFEVMSEFF